eukprot:TRINITY_DN13475_c0_g1_i2.p1 TRINITY_DN13475_c0_g1~~TRINITY_DN13475_c0_g1_i2.p1  ORF type:complete len:665 (-),score=182.93 TRINITY_DN13475_c0_g1_i2:219-2213(-)
MCIRDRALEDLILSNVSLNDSGGEADTLMLWLGHSSGPAWSAVLAALEALSGGCFLCMPPQSNKDHAWWLSTISASAAQWVSLGSVLASCVEVAIWRHWDQRKKESTAAVWAERAQLHKLCASWAGEQHRANRTLIGRSTRELMAKALRRLHRSRKSSTEGEDSRRQLLLALMAKAAVRVLPPVRECHGHALVDALLLPSVAQLGSVFDHLRLVMLSNLRDGFIELAHNELMPSAAPKPKPKRKPQHSPLWFCKLLERYRIKLCCAAVLRGRRRVLALSTMAGYRHMVSTGDAIQRAIFNMVTAAPTTPTTGAPFVREATKAAKAASNATSRLQAGWKRWRCLLVSSLQAVHQQPVPPRVPSELHTRIVAMAHETAAAQQAAHSVQRFVLEALEAAGKRIWPGGFVGPEVYGSRATGLALAEADMDVAMLFKWSQSQMQQAERIMQLTHALDQLPWASQVNPIPFASTPLLHFKLPPNSLGPGSLPLQVDVSIGGQGTHHGTQVATLVRSLVDIEPGLRPCVLFLKRILYDGGGMGTAQGGMSGYMLVLIAANFLINRGCDTQEEDLGRVAVLLMRHVMYALDPDTGRTDIILDPAHLTSILPDTALLEAPVQPQPSANTTLVVMDPLQPGNNVARLCYRLRELLQLIRQELSTHRGRTITLAG